MNRRWARALVIIASFLVVAVHLHTRLYMSQIQGWDYRYYVAMASSRTFVEVPAPYAYRWIPHKLVAYVPLPPKRTYEVVNAVALCSAAFVMVEWLIRMGYAADHSVPVVVLGFTWSMFGGVFYQWGRFPTEPTGYLLIAAGIYAVHFWPVWRIVVLVMVGMLCREQSFLLVPYFYLARYGIRGSGPGLGKTALLGLAALAVFASVRIVTPTVGDYSYLTAIRGYLTAKLSSPGTIFTLVVSLAAHAGVLSGVLLLTGRTSLKAIVEKPYIGFWLLANLLLAVLGGTDTDRIAYYAFPAELLMFCVVLQKIGFRWVMPWAGVAGMFAVGQVAISGTFSDGRFHPPNVAPTWCALSLVIWTAGVGLLGRRAIRVLEDDRVG